MFKFRALLMKLCMFFLHILVHLNPIIDFSEVIPQNLVRFVVMLLISTIFTVNGLRFMIQTILFKAIIFHFLSPTHAKFNQFLKEIYYLYPILMIYILYIVKQSFIVKCKTTIILLLILINDMLRWIIDLIGILKNNRR